MLSVLSALDLGIPVGRSCSFACLLPSSPSPSVAWLINTEDRRLTLLCRSDDVLAGGHFSNAGHGIIIGVKQTSLADADASLCFTTAHLLLYNIPAVPWAFHPRLHHTIASRHKDVLSNLEVHFHVDPSFWIGLSFICS